MAISMVLDISQEVLEFWRKSRKIKEDEKKKNNKKKTRKVRTTI